MFLFYLLFVLNNVLKIFHLVIFIIEKYYLTKYFSKYTYKNLLNGLLFFTKSI